MARELIDAVTRALGWVRRGHRHRPRPGEPLKVNLGSSLLVADGWLNVDGSLAALAASWPRPALLRLLYRLSGMAAHMGEDEYVETLRGNRFVHHNLEHGIPLPDACAGHLFSSHFIEHLSREDGEQLLREALRVLRPGGLIRISTPDLAWMVRRYTDGDGFEAMEGFFEDERGYFARHRFMYDEAMLRALLERVGFTAVTRCAFREGRVPDLETLDNRPGSLVLEAQKPA